jgi:hypothetical protein
MRLTIVEAIMHHANLMRLNMKKTINVEARSISFTFEDGLEPVTIGLAQLEPANVTYAALHGLSARLGDNAAISKSAENGFKVTEAMKREAVMELVTHYTSGSKDWSPKAKAAPKVAFNPAIAAIAAKLGKSYEEAMVWYNAKLMAELDAM